MSGSFGQSNSNMYNLSKLGHKNLATITYLVHICTYLLKCLAKLGSSFSYYFILHTITSYFRQMCSFSIWRISFEKNNIRDNEKLLMFTLECKFQLMLVCMNSLTQNAKTAPFLYTLARGWVSLDTL